MGVKFSQIGNSAANFALGDKIVGVQSGTADVLFSLIQLKQGIDPELDSDTTFYVRTDGNDSNNGLANTPAGAWLTLQHAIDFLTDTELGGFTATVQIADGSYAGITTGNKSNMTGIIALVGNIVTQANVVVTPVSGHCFGITGDFNITITGVAPTGTGRANGEIGIVASSPMVSCVASVINFNNLAACVDASLGAYFNIFSTWNITGDGVTALYSTDGAIFRISSAATLVGTPDFSSSFIEVNTNGLFEGGSTFTGGATGKRFIVSTGGVINTTTNNLTYFPGNVAGTINPGGQYDNIIGAPAATTVTNLPPVGVVPQGQRAFATDSTVTFVSSNLGLVVTGTSSNLVPVYSDGTDWRIG